MRARTAGALLDEASQRIGASARPFAEGDCVRVTVDMRRRRVSFAVNGYSVEGACAGPRAAAQRSAMTCWAHAQPIGSCPPKAWWRW
jgi:hypothetical protein